MTGEHERGEVIEVEVLETLPATKVARKVSIPTLVNTGLVAMLGVLAALGFDLDEASPLVDAVVENFGVAVAAVYALATSVQGLVGYFTRERRV